jgi:hypothetical protein
MTRWEMDYTWVGSDETDYCVTPVGDSHRVLNRSVDEVSPNVASLVHNLNLLDGNVAGNSLHGNNVESRAVNVKRMSGIERHTYIPIGEIFLIITNNPRY